MERLRTSIIMSVVALMTMLPVISYASPDEESPEVDKAIQGIKGRPAIRGREQQLIDYYGGVGNPKVANRIRGVSKINPGGRLFHAASNSFFGNIAPYTGY